MTSWKKPPTWRWLAAEPVLAPGEQINGQQKFENNFSILQFIVYNYFKSNQNINKIFESICNMLVTHLTESHHLVVKQFNVIQLAMEHTKYWSG